MTYTPPTSPVEASWVGQRAYKPPTFHIRATWNADSTQWVYQPPSIAAPVAASPAVRLGHAWAAPSGVAPLQLGRVAVWGQRKSAYNPAQFHQDASWLGANAYAPGIGYVRGSWDLRITYVAPGSFDDEAFGTPHLYGTQFIRPEAWDSYQPGANHYALHSFQYAPPQWVLNASWVGADPYVPVTGVLPAAWALPAENKQVSLAGWSSSVIATGASVISWRAIAYPLGIAAPAVPNPHVRNGAAAVLPGGFNALTMGAARIWNRRQYLLPGGFTLTLPFGTAYVQGGVRIVTPTGIAALGMGAVTVINTKADQTARPTGIATPGMGSANVSPRMLWPTGIMGTTFGFPRVQFPPQPAGWVSSAFGYPTVADKTKYVRPGGLDQLAIGYPVVRDRAQKIHHQASAITSLFGDVQVRTTTLRVKVPGLDSLEMSPWAEARNTRRHLLVPAIAAPGVGAAAQVRNKTPSIAPVGLPSQAFGRADIGWRVRRVTPTGVPLPFPQFGTASLWQTPSLAPPGIAAPALPVPTVWPGVRYVEAKGANTLLMGAATVDFNYRRIVAEGNGIAGASYGAAGRVEHARRTIGLLGQSFMAFGTPWVSYGLRALAPEGIEFPGMSRHSIAGSRYIGAVGFEATRWLTRIVPESQEIFPKTFGAAYGWPTVHNNTRYLRPEGVRTYPEDAMHWGVAKAWNRRQVITMVEDQSSELWPLPWPQWTAIENRNKKFGAIGFNATRVGNHQIDNGARPVLPSGIAFPVLPEFQKTGSVTHRVRPLPLDGFDSLTMSGWSVVHNGARVLKPSGFVATDSGRAALENTRRYRKVQSFETSVFGYPMVAYRIRELTFESRYGIQPPYIQLPVVDLHTRYVAPPSMENPGLGNASLTIFFRRITPRWTLQHFFGSPALRNLTPELQTRGRVTEEFGDTHVRLEWRPVDPEGTSMQLFGRTKIADRKQTITVPGANFMIVSDKLRAIRIGEDPVVTQYIDLRGMFIDDNDIQQESDVGYGIAPPLGQVGNPNLLKGYIYLRPESPMTLFGQPVVTANSIRVEPGIFDYYVGEPFVSLKVRTIAAQTIGQLVQDGGVSGISEMGSWGMPRLSPHTIYAVMEAPAQAQKNHQSKGTLHVVRAFEEFGQARVAGTRDNIIRPVGLPSSGSGGPAIGVGSPILYNKRQSIKTNGVSMMRLGWVTIPGPQTIVVEDAALGYGFGRASLGPPPYVGPSYIKPIGQSFTGWGATMVDHRHRTLLGKGFASQAMGASTGSTTNNMPQSLHVGPPDLHRQVGFDAAGYGNAWISHWVRGLEPEGFDGFASEYDYQNFAQRMRVRNATSPWVGRDIITTGGHRSSRVGTPGVRPGVHYIRPDGNSDQYRKGVPQ